jgi:hypothetical protein
MFEIYDGDMLLFTVNTQYEADEAAESGFTVKELQNA